MLRGRLAEVCRIFNIVTCKADAKIHGCRESSHVQPTGVYLFRWAAELGGKKTRGRVYFSLGRAYTAKERLVALPIFVARKLLASSWS